MRRIKNLPKNLFSLSFLLPLFLGVFTLFLVFVFGYSSYQVSRKTLTASVLNSFTKDAHLAKTQIVDFLEYQFQALRAIEETPPIQAIFRAVDNEGIDPQSGDDLDIWRQRLGQIMSGFIKADLAAQRLQLSPLDEEGIEIVRVNRLGEAIIKVPIT